MGRTDARISWRGETSHPTAPSWVNLPTHSRSQSMAKATSQSYAHWPESSVTVHQPVPVRARRLDRLCLLASLTPLVSVAPHPDGIGNVGGIDTTFDTTEWVTRRNGGQPSARKTA